MVKKHLREDEASVAIGSDFCPAQALLDVAVLCACFPSQTDENSISEVLDPLDPEVGSGQLPRVSLPAHDRVTSLDVLLGQPGSARMRTWGSKLAAMASQSSRLNEPLPDARSPRCAQKCRPPPRKIPALSRTEARTQPRARAQEGTWGRWRVPISFVVGVPAHGRHDLSRDARLPPFLREPLSGGARLVEIEVAGRPH